VTGRIRSPKASSLKGNHGLLRLGEGEKVVALFRDHHNIPLIHVEAQALFLEALTGVTDPEVKRKTIGALFIGVFEAEAKKLAADGGPGDFVAFKYLVARCLKKSARSTPLRI
jgi:GMP synthase PP-ATPase subunit